jgi:type IV pilus assembly protein PilF
MRFSPILMLLMLLAVGGCVVQPAAPEVRPDANTTGSETDERTRARVHTELAAGYFEVGNMSVALEEVAVALRADANYSPAYSIAGLIYSALKEDRLAEQNYGQALRINPLDSDANNNYGWFLCQRKREADGIKHILDALRNPLYRNADRSYVNAGLCSRQRGDAVAAEEYFQKALAVRPNQLQALYQMADIAYGRGDYAAAKTYLNRFTQTGTANAEVLWLGVRVERKVGDRNSEATYALQLSRNFPDSKEARALLAGQYE